MGRNKPTNCTESLQQALNGNEQAINLFDMAVVITRQHECVEGLKTHGEGSHFTIHHSRTFCQDLKFTPITNHDSKSDDASQDTWAGQACRVTCLAATHEWSAVFEFLIEQPVVISNSPKQMSRRSKPVGVCSEISHHIHVLHIVKPFGHNYELGEQKGCFFLKKFPSFLALIKMF